ncbi:terminase gpA endonuclease subunit [Brevundimonas sp. Bb-A]|uniref:terminase gpA endonuclease subunit n=1 Tax=Brevundimonas sp. Bb-A TaxID=2560058 RepID=UPI00128F8753|nr:terminase gpA endonuclease subunit [Brevundimonas sp. Bb-A]QFU30288.1 Phage terminase large subunit (GpA) [Brevundimonas sp. Bb-A]
MSLFSAQEIARQAATLVLAMAAAVTPAPDQTISAWAEGRINIPGETGTTREGELSWDGFEYLIEPLDRLHPDDPARTVTFVGSAQIAKTTVGVIATLYYSTVIARPWGVALPSGDEALKYNRTKWQPLVDATPELRRKIRAVTSRDEQGSTNTYKRFPGGYGQFFGTTSAKPLQMVTFCLVVKEETPNWSLSVGDRGDPHKQIEVRQLQWELAGAKTFHNSTPGLVRRSEEGTGEATGCPVTADFLAGDQRRLYLPCPHCAHLPGGVLIRLDREAMLGVEKGETPHFCCPSCGGVIEHRHKRGMVAACRPDRQPANGVRGGWIPCFPSEDPTNPAPGSFIPAGEYEAWRARPLEGRQPSYHAWQVVSDAVDWAYIAKQIQEADDEEAKIALHQQIFGEAYEVTVQQADVDKLLERRDNRLTKGVVPSGYEIVTVAADLNGDWAQWTAYAWGPEAEHVVVDKGRIEGGPSEPQIWAELAELERRRWPHEDGGFVTTEVQGVDSGYGTYHVYAFCSSHAKSKALDGAKGWGLTPLRRSTGKPQKLEGPEGRVVTCRTWRVGTWDLKRTLMNEAIPLSLEGEKGARAPRRPHWPGWVERDFFEELTGEALVSVQDSKTGVVKDEAWVRVRRRNEELDLWVYNKALAASLGIGVPGAEPDWLELARRRQAQQAGLEALWERPPSAGARSASGLPATANTAPASLDVEAAKRKWSF